MTAYTAEVLWSRSGQKFIDNRYSRKHVLRFDGGIEVVGSSSPHVVPLPYSVPNAVDPEEAFVSSLSICHMLWFLSIAAKHEFVVDCYHDIAEGVMEKDSRGKLMMSVVTLRPKVTFSGEKQREKGPGTIIPIASMQRSRRLPANRPAGRARSLVGVGYVKH